MHLSRIQSLIEEFLHTHPEWVIMIWWATATGKTALAVSLSDFFGLEVISADSRQIYRWMDIGTDKISWEIRKNIPHHQIDLINPDEIYTSSQRQRDTYTLIDQIHERGKIPMIVGGTGLYIDTIYKNFSIPEVKPDRTYRNQLQDSEEQNPGILHTLLQWVDPVEAEQIHPNSIRYLIRALEIHHHTGIPKSILSQQQPVRHPLLMLWLRRDTPATNQRINQRVHQMIQQWLVQEVEQLIQQWYSTTSPWMKCIGYSETLQYLDKQYDMQELIERIKIHSHQYAKRQRTRFRRYKQESIQNKKNLVDYQFIIME